MKSKIIGDDSTSIVYDIGDNKVIKISKNGMCLEKEAKIQSSLGTIAPEIFAYRDNWIIMEKMDGTLYEIIKEHKPDSPMFNLIKEHAKRDVRDSIKFMHKKGVIHSDLKMSNIFYKIVDNTYKFYIGDFGMAIKTKKDLTDKNTIIRIMCKRWRNGDNIKFVVNEVFNTIRYEFETM